MRFCEPIDSYTIFLEQATAHERRSVKTWVDFYSRITRQDGLLRKDWAEVKQAVAAKRSTDEVTQDTSQALRRLDEQDFQHLRRVIWTEATWRDDGRPFYNVWPQAIEAVSTANVDAIPFGDLPKMPVSVCCLRLPHPGYVGQDKRRAINNIWVVQAPERKGFGILFRYTIDGNAQSSTAWSLFLPDRCTLNMFTSQLEHEFANPETVALVTVEACRLAARVLLLASDPQYLERILLAVDQQRVERGYPIQKAQERAKARGLFGWDIGRSISREVRPHLRTPHMAIRHTGRGRTVPKLVRIRGAVIHAPRFGDIPTGWMDRLPEDDKPETDENNNETTA